jgi:hypothetical protein|tara:strand:- start:173 stop:373 length:201 start_codon:yes stop_codon:yes gene_type:complete
LRLSEKADAKKKAPIAVIILAIGAFFLFSQFKTKNALLIKMTYWDEIFSLAVRYARQRLQKIHPSN